MLQLKEDAAAAEWAAELLELDPSQSDYVQLRVRALLLDSRVEEAEAVVEEWVELTGDPSPVSDLWE